MSDDLHREILGDAIDAFLRAVLQQQREAADQVYGAEPRIADVSVHVAAVLGREAELRRLIAEAPARVHERVGEVNADPLLWLCYSPFHGESDERDDALAATATVLLEAGADPNTRDGRYQVPALYAVTGMNNAPRIAQLLLDAGASVNDGESLFHAAEHFHEEALALLLRYGADVNARGDWGNTPLYFLIRYHDITVESPRWKGILWLLDHGADPNVRSGREQETALHVAARRGHLPELVKLLIEHGADVHARRADNRTAWNLAGRNAHDALVALLEEFGAEPETISSVDVLIRTCARGDIDAARALSRHDLLMAFTDEDLRMLPEAAAAGRAAVVNACLAAGFPVNTIDQMGATALHHAAIRGDAKLVGELLEHGADTQIRDHEHAATPFEWGEYGRQHFGDAEGDYPRTRQLLQP